MESTGVYWKSPHAALEAIGIRATMVNARHVKQVPGRKTDVGDAQWLPSDRAANLARLRTSRKSMWTPETRAVTIETAGEEWLHIQKELSPEESEN